MKLLIVSKRTAWENRRDDPRIAELVRRKDPSVGNIVPAHDEHSASFDEVMSAVMKVGVPHDVVLGARSELSGTYSAVVTVGGDGTVLAASHSPLCDFVPVLGVNSAPSFSVGNFCRSSAKTFRKDLILMVNGLVDRVPVTRMSVALNGAPVSHRVLNEALVSDACPAAMSRYILRRGGREEEHRSSGFWIGTAAGSTGAQRSAGGEAFGPASSKELQVVVRELFQTSGVPWARMRTDGASAVSKMADGRAWLDGSHVAVPFAIGDVLHFGLSDHPLQLLEPRRVS